MHRQSPPHTRSRRFPYFVLISLVVVALVAIFRHAILLMCAKTALWYWAGDAIHYDQLRCQEGKLVLEGLRWEEEGMGLRVDRIDVDWDYTTSPFALTPHVCIVHPEIHLNNEATSHKKWFPVGLLPSPHFAVDWNVQNGVIQIAEQRYYFHFEGSQEEIGTLHVCYDPQIEPFFQLVLQKEEEGIACDFKLEEIDAHRLLPLMPLFAQDLSKGWETFQGELCWDGRALFSSSLDLQKLESHFLGEKISIENRTQGWHAKMLKCQADFNYTSSVYPDSEKKSALVFWDRLKAHLSINGGECRLQSPFVQEECRIESIEANGELAPQTLPEWTLQATFKQGGKAFPFSLKGKGERTEEGTFWVETALTVLPRSEKKSHALISLCSLLEEKYLVQMEWSNLGHDHLDIARNFIPLSLPLQWLEGQTEGKAMVWLKGNQPTRCLLDHLQADNLHASSEGMTASAQSFSAEGEFSTDAKENWKIDRLKGECSGASLVCQGQKPIHLAGTFSCDRGDWAGTVFEGQYGNLKGELRWNAHSVDLDLKGPLGSLLQADFAGCLGIPEQIPFLSAEALLKASWKMGEISGSLSAEGGTCQFGVETLPLISLSRLPQVKEGWFRCENITSALYAPLLQAHLPELSVEGTLAFSGTFDSQKIHLEILAEHFLASQHHFALQAEKIGDSNPQSKTEKRALFQYDRMTQKWQGAIPLQAARLVHKDSNTAIEEITTLLRFQADPDHWQMRAFLSDLSMPLSAKTHIEKGQCSLVFDSAQGIFEIADAKGNLLLANNKNYHWIADKFSFQIGTEPLVQFDCKLLDGKQERMRLCGTAQQIGPWQCTFDPKTTHFWGNKLQIHKLIFEDFSKIHSMEVHSEIKCQQLLAQLEFLEAAGILSSKEMVKPLQNLQPQGTLLTHLQFEEKEAAWAFTCKSHDLLIASKPVGQFFLKGKWQAKEWTIEQLHAGAFFLKTVILPQNGTFSFSACEAKWKDWTVKGQALLAIEPDQILFSLFPLKVEFPLKTTEKISFPLSLETSKKIGGTFSLDNGLTIKDVDLVAYSKPRTPISHFHVQEVLYQNNQWQGKQIAVRLPKEGYQALSQAQIVPVALQPLQFDKALEGTFDASLSAKGFSLQGLIKDGIYGIDTHLYPLSQIGILYDTKSFCLRCKTTVSELPIIANLQVELTSEPYGMVKIQESPKAEGLQALFRTSSGLILCESIQGHLSGLEVHLAKNQKSSLPNTSVLAGSIKLDLQKMQPLFSKEIQKSLEKFKLGKGFALQGQLLLAGKETNFQGKWIGSEFELMGYRLKAGEANLFACAQNVQLSNLEIKDPAGKISVKQIKGHLDGDAWGIDIPLIYINELRPSALSTTDATKPLIKPLVIRNFSLSNITGSIGKRIELEGKGALTFTNAFKKESSIFETPIQALKNLGLDPGLFTPVQGEVELELHGDKFYITQLKEVFSEERRSEFYLPFQPDGSYVDLEGNIHIDLKMRQNVVLKWTEPFTLTVRGTLKKPRYSLQ